MAGVEDRTGRKIRESRSTHGRCFGQDLMRGDAPGWYEREIVRL